MVVVFSDPAQHGGSDLLDVVSVLDHDVALERAVDLAVARTAAATALLVVHDRPGSPVALSRGVDRPGAEALWHRLDDGSSRGSAPLPEVLRLHDPGTGGEVLRVPVVVGLRCHADLVLADPPGGRFADDAVLGIAPLGRVAAVAVRNAITYATSERRREAEQATARLDEVLRRPDMEPEAWMRVAEGAARIAGADLAAVVLGPGEEHGDLDVVSALGDTEQLPVLIDLLADRLREVGAEGQGLEELSEDGGVVVLAPLVPELAPTAVLLLHLGPERARYGPEDRELLAAFAGHSALVLDRLALHDERQRALLAADRGRIARDLHDVVIQRLIATGMRLRIEARTGQEVPAELLEDTVAELEESVTDIRRTVFELERPRHASLRADAAALGRYYAPVLGFAPRVRCRGPVDALVPDQIAAHATAVLREALSNCARHARAGSCDVDLAVEDGWLRLEVLDDGRGPGVEGAASHSGLRNLALRAGQLGGDLRVTGAHPCGTRLVWRVPLAAHDGGGASSASTRGEAGTGRSSAEPADSSTQQVATTSR